MNKKDLYGLDNHLTNFVGGTYPNGMIAGAVADIVRVNKESGQYFRWDSDSAGRVANAERANGAQPNVLNRGMSTPGTYRATERTFASELKEQDLANADVPKFRENLAMLVKNAVILDLEARMADEYRTTSNYDSSNVVTPAVKWDDSAFTGSIKEAFDEVKSNIVLSDLGNDFVNKGNESAFFAIIPYKVAQVIARDSGVMELVKYTNPNLLAGGVLPPKLWECEVYIASTGYNPNVKGASSQAHSFIWGDDIIIGRKTGTASGLMVPSFSKVFVHQKYPSLDGYIRTWLDKSANFTEFIEYVTYNDVKITSDVGGGMIHNVLS